MESKYTIRYTIRKLARAIILSGTAAAAINCQNYQEPDPIYTKCRMVINSPLLADNPGDKAEYKELCLSRCTRERFLYHMKNGDQNKYHNTIGKRNSEESIGKESIEDAAEKAKKECQMHLNRLLHDYLVRP